VVTVEDGVRAGGVGAMVAQALRDAVVTTPLRDFGIPARFLDHGKRAEVLAEVGLTAQDIAREVVEAVARHPMIEFDVAQPDDAETPAEGPSRS
jgi:1-deoxy-D-xylulose-5-phosphate synthase